MDSEAAAQKRAVLAAKLEAEIAALRDAELTAQKLASQKTAELVFQTEAEIAAKRESELASHKEAELAQRQAHLMQKNIAEMAVQRQAQESEKARRLKRETEAAAEFALEEEKHKKEMATRRAGLANKKRSQACSASCGRVPRCCHRGSAGSQRTLATRACST
eukprot:Platyproteum_vivax@DN7674_c0_g1_i12.p1